MPFAHILVAAILLLLILPQTSFAQYEDGPPEDMEDTGMQVERKRRPRIRIGPEKSKRPGGLGKEVFKDHIEAIESFLKPLAGNIVSVSGDTLSADLTDESGAVPGMRFSVMRATAAFAHPVTGEKVTGTESPVGLAEVTGTKEGQVRLRLLEGEAARGDIVRILSAPVTVLFYQDAAVDWDVSEEYYFWLVGSDRFKVIDAAPGTHGQEEILKAATEIGASVVVSITGEPVVPEGLGPGVALRQRVLWALDGSEFYSSVMFIDEETLGKLKIAGEMFWPEKGKPVLEMESPFRAVLLETADLNCDGEDEMVLSSGTSLRVFAFDINLRAPFGLEGPLEIKGEAGREHVWLEALDIDEDGCDELLVSTVKDDHEARSFVYKYSLEGINVVWKGDVFARFLDGGLYIQDYNSEGGYRGKVRKLEYRDGGWTDDAGSGLEGLPEGVNVHDFAFVNSHSGLRHMMAQDESGNLVLFNGVGGEKLWRSDDSYGGGLKQFKQQSLAAQSGVEEASMWHVSDRMLSRNSQLLAIYKVPISKRVPGLGFRGSGIIRLSNPGPETREEVLIRDIPRAVAGMAVSGQRLYVLRDTYDVNLMNLFKGRKIFVSKILVYSLEGM